MSKLAAAMLEAKEDDEDEDEDEGPKMKSPGVVRKYKPVINIGVNVDTVPPSSAGHGDWRKEEHARLKAEVDALKRELSSFNAKEAADRVRKALEIRLKLKSLRLEETKLKTSPYGGISDVY